MSYNKLRVKNDFENNSNYITKSQINARLLKSMNLRISVLDAKKTFDSCNGKLGVTGNRLNNSQQRHTKYVSLYELSRKIRKF